MYIHFKSLIHGKDKHDNLRTKLNYISAWDQGITA